MNEAKMMATWVPTNGWKLQPGWTLRLPDGEVVRVVSVGPMAARVRRMEPPKTYSLISAHSEVEVRIKATQ